VAAFGAGAVLLDNMNRANQNPLGLSWANANSGGSPNIQILANQAACDAAGTGEVYWTAASYGPDVDVYMTLPVLAGTGNAFRVKARIKDVPGTATQDGYQIRTNEQVGGANDQVFIEVMTNGTPTTLGATITQELTAGDKLGLRCEGSSISAYLFTGGAWTLLGTRTDTTYPLAGFVGFGIRNSTGRVDDFFAGAIPGDTPGGGDADAAWWWSG
jgi:hypothetical protein